MRKLEPTRGQYVYQNINKFVVNNILRFAKGHDAEGKNELKHLLPNAGGEKWGDFHPMGSQSFKTGVII